MTNAQHHHHRTRTLWLTGVLHAFTHMYGVALLPLYLGIQKDLRLASVEQATSLVTVYGLAYILPSYFLGVLADRWSRKQLLAWGLAINAAGLVILSFAPGYAWAMASMVLGGIGGSFYHPSATALIARLFPEARGRALGLVGMGASVGFFLGPLYCGWRSSVAGSWRTPILEIGILGLVAAGLFAWLADEERDEPIGSGPGDPVPAASIQSKGKMEPMFPTAVLWIFFLGAALLLSLRDFSGSGMATSTSLFLQQARGFDVRTAGLMLSAIFVASTISNPLIGRLSDTGRLRWLVLVLSLAAALIAIFPLVSGAWMPVVLLLYGFFFMASYPITEAALMEAVPDSVRGRVFGLFLTITGLISNFSHWAVGAWVHRLGTKAGSPSSFYPIYWIMAAMVLCSLFALLCLRGIRRREALAPHPSSHESPPTSSSSPDQP